MEYEKCLVQVYEILNYLDGEELEKIPEEVIRNIEKRKDNNYVWNYDESKPLNEQVLDRKTIAILSYINMEYLLNEEEKEYIEKLHKFNEDKLYPKVGIDDFNKNADYDVKYNKETNVNLIEIKEQKWYQKIFVFLKRIFNKK